MPTNPVLTTDLPYTLPDFAAATPADYRRAIEAGMAAQRAGLDRLRDDTAAPTVENVLGALRVPATADKAAIEQAAIACEAFQKFAPGATPKKVVVVPGRLVNVVL